MVHLKLNNFVILQHSYCVSYVTQVYNPNATQFKHFNLGNFKEFSSKEKKVSNQATVLPVHLIKTALAK